MIFCWIALQYPEAVTAFKAVIGLAGDNIDARRGLLEVYKKTDDTPSTIVTLTELCDILGAAGYGISPGIRHTVGFSLACVLFCLQEAHA